MSEGGGGAAGPTDLTNVDGLFATDRVAAGTVIFTEQQVKKENEDTPFCLVHQPCQWEKGASNCDASRGTPLPGDAPSAVFEGSSPYHKPLPITSPCPSQALARSTPASPTH